MVQSLFPDKGSLLQSNLSQRGFIRQILLKIVFEDVFQEDR
ncbi:Hypothetical protein ETEE_3604 [Edwardsiella anguillarum ET080813]|uniref:Uncharacterized protein n=1 Tax=Edwardsiella anguillarum ET080813 TaxID=667120 RepID=A0A076LX84_9GAMM|nr:Hypothetical protein ETEE_3604 [Edwardsiella anguillarum ET080813]